VTRLVPVRGAALLLVVTLVVATCAIAAVVVPSPHAGAASLTSIASFAENDGDRVVTVPDGRYRGGTINRAHHQTGGPLRGWVVLVAQTRGGVVVDLTDAPLVLGPRASRILFVGIHFENGSVDVRGNNIGFWYTDHTFPATVWAREGPRGHPEDGVYHSADTVHAYTDSTRDVTFAGADVHHTGDAFDISNSHRTTIVGTHIWALSDQGVDPNDTVHPDAIDGVGGGSTELHVADSWVQGRIILKDRAGEAGGHRDFLFENDWVSNSPSAGFTFTASRGGGIFGERRNIRSWGHTNGHDRIDQIDGRVTYDSAENREPSRIDVRDVDVVTRPPAAGAVNPAEEWRGAHPYDSWDKWFDLEPARAERASAPPDASTSDGGSGSTVVVIVVIALVVVVAAVIVVILRTRSRRRRAA
jgi:hypothetical protein